MGFLGSLYLPADPISDVIRCELVYRGNQVAELLLPDEQRGWSQPPEYGTVHFRIGSQVKPDLYRRRELVPDGDPHLYQWPEEARRADETGTVL